MNQTTDKPILKLIKPDADNGDLGRTMLRLATHAAATHRFAAILEQHTGGATNLDWRGLRLTDDSGQGRPETSPIARLGGPEATEGNR